jgi:hypothetical protein
MRSTRIRANVEQSIWIFARSPTPHYYRAQIIYSTLFGQFPFRRPTWKETWTFFGREIWSLARSVLLSDPGEWNNPVTVRSIKREMPLDIKSLSPPHLYTASSPFGSNFHIKSHSKSHSKSHIKSHVPQLALAQSTIRDRCSHKWQTRGVIDSRPGFYTIWSFPPKNERCRKEQE